MNDTKRNFPWVTRGTSVGSEHWPSLWASARRSRTRRGSPSPTQTGTVAVPATHSEKTTSSSPDTSSSTGQPSSDDRPRHTGGTDKPRTARRHDGRFCAPSSAPSGTSPTVSPASGNAAASAQAGTPSRASTGGESAERTTSTTSTEHHSTPAHGPMSLADRPQMNVESDSRPRSLSGSSRPIQKLHRAQAGEHAAQRCDHACAADGHHSGHADTRRRGSGRASSPSSPTHSAQCCSRW